MNDENLLSILRQLLGRTGQHQGVSAQAIDLILDPPTLLIRQVGQSEGIQLDAHGRPRSRTARLWQIRVYLDASRSPPRINPALLPWLSPAQAAALTRIQPAQGGD